MAVGLYFIINYLLPEAKLMYGENIVDNNVIARPQNEETTVFI
jgi:hypothetical protein